jgi:hypothetical protein
MTSINSASHSSLDEGASMKPSRSFKRVLPAALAAGLMVLAAVPAQAYDFSSGDWSGNIYATVSYGASWRLKDTEPGDVGKQSILNDPAVFSYDKLTQRTVPGLWSANGDDGILNYPDSGDLISHAIKATVEAKVDWRNFGAFTRFSAFYDFENADKDVLSDVAKDRVGKDIRLLDLYIYGNHQLSDKFLNWRLGKQVVSWGESTFIQGGINVINPVDVSKLRVAGAELKEAFEGVNMLWGSVDLTPSVALEALYMFEYREIIPDPSGTYFATSDIGTPGASYAMLGFVYPQPVINPDLYGPVCLQGNLAASDSPLPPELVAVGCGLSLRRSESVFPKDSGQYGVAVRWFLESLGSTELGFYFLNYHSRLPVVSGSSVFTLPPPFLNSYWTEYPEDIHLLGASFNTNIGTWALAGEISYRPNAPLQIDDVETLFAGLTPTNVLQPSYYFQYKSQLGVFGPNEYIKGWDEHKQWQGQATTTKLFGPGNIFRANQIALVAEVGVNYVSDLPSQDFMRYEGPGTDSGGGPDWTSGDWNNPETQVDGFADDLSWGYRIATRFDYYNAIGAVTISPRLGWYHDVSGTTPGPGGSFVEGRKQLTLGVSFDYLNEWVFDFAYTRYMGAGDFNQLINRDFFSASVSYSF